MQVVASVAKEGYKYRLQNVQTEPPDFLVHGTLNIETLSHRSYLIFLFGLSPIIRYVHTGDTDGGMGAMDGFGCPHPSREPRRVSSSAASNAAPQFGSLGSIIS